MKFGKFFLALAVLTLALLACSNFNFNRGDDGSLRVETNLSLDLIRTALEAAGNFDQVIGLTLEPRNGYIFVHADVVEVEGITGNDVSFHLELGSSEGHLTVRISNVQAGNNVFDESTFESYNQLIADSLAQLSDLNDRATVESVSVTPDGVSMVWVLDASLNN